MNHFIEVNKGKNYYLAVHSGSRHLGLEVANYYQKIAIEKLKEQKEKDIIGHTLNEMGKLGIDLHFINSYPNEIHKSPLFNVPKDLAFLSGEDKDHYLHDMQIVQEFAYYNRVKILDIINDTMGGDFLIMDELYMINTTHNYIGNDNILRKGAVSAREGETLMIPMNMRDGVLLCRGKGNPDWNYSAPHGAGRIMGRARAKRSLSLEDYKAEMGEVFTTSVSLETIDEAPMAYKPMESILEVIGDTVEVLDILKPIYNFKAGE